MVFFALFALLALYVYRSSLYDRPQREQHAEVSSELDKSLTDKVFIALFATILLILVRNVYRLRVRTHSRQLHSKHRVGVYVFDMLAILAALLVYICWQFEVYMPGQQFPVSPNKDDPQVAELSWCQLLHCTC